MTQSAITFPLPGSRESLQCGIEWELTCCVQFNIAQSTQHEYTEVTTRVIL